MKKAYTIAEAVAAGVIDNLVRSDWIVGAPPTARIVHHKRKYGESIRYVACGNPECKVSTSVAETMTFGSGELDDNGFWEHPCKICEDDHRRRYPEGQ